MADCRIDNKKHPTKPHTFCYRCKKDDCKEECVLTFTVDNDGKVIEKVTCACKKIKWDPPRDPKDGCRLDELQDPEEKTHKKFYLRCEKADCKKNCVLWIEYGEGPEKATDFEHIKNYGCDCIDWD